MSLTIRYRQIKRVLADFRHEKGRGQFSLYVPYFTHFSNIELLFRELYFHLSSPAVIRRIKLYAQDPKKPSTSNLLNRQGDRYISWDLRDVYLAGEVNESPIFRIMLCDLVNEEYCQVILLSKYIFSIYLKYIIFYKLNPICIFSYSIVWLCLQSVMLSFVHSHLTYFYPLTSLITHYYLF